MGQSFYQGTQQMFNALNQRLEASERQLMSLSHVLKEIVGKELMRGQALHKVLMDKGIFTDEDLKKGLEDIIAEAKADLEKEAAKVQEEKAEKIEILVPSSFKGEAAPVVETPKTDGE